jgi:hypothetical protein
VSDEELSYVFTVDDPTLRFMLEGARANDAPH